MEESLVHPDVMFISNHESSEVSHPGDAAFNLPTPLVSSQLSPILRWQFATIAFVRADQFDASLLKPLAQRIGVGGLVVDQSPGIFAWPAASSRDRDALQRRFDQRRFVRGRRGKLNSQRNTLAACHHHPLRTLSAFGFSDALAPFFAGAKEPSAKVSSQSSRPCSSSSPRNVRQIVSQTSCSSQSRSLRQQVLGEGYCLGRSLHLAPDRSTQRMPSKQRRSSTRRRPPAADDLILGNNGSILFHCSSVSSESCRDIKRIPFHVTLNRKFIAGANLSLARF